MKKLLLILVLFPLLISGTTPINDNVDINIMGIWRNMDNEFVQITRNMDFEVTFQRIASDRHLVSKGKINTAIDGNMEIKREYPIVQTYSSNYVLSPSGKTLVIMQPDGEHAWLFEKIQ